MPVYEFQCPLGHVQERSYPVSECPQTTLCRCGKRAKKIVSRLGSFAVAGTTGPTKDDDDDVRQARAEHRKMCAWGEAAGTLNVKSDSAPTRDAEVTSQDVAECKAALARGEKIPEEFREIAPKGHYDAVHT